MGLKKSDSFSGEGVQALFIPLAVESISAGFPSPAEDYIELDIDLNSYLIKNPISSFFLRVSGNSMNNTGIYNNDLLIVDRSINPKSGDVVVAILDGEFTLKRYIKDNKRYYLRADKEDYPAIDLNEYNEVMIWGVAIYSIHKL